MEEFEKVLEEISGFSDDYIKTKDVHEILDECDGYRKKLAKVYSKLTPKERQTLSQEYVIAKNTLNTVETLVCELEDFKEDMCIKDTENMQEVKHVDTSYNIEKGRKHIALNIGIMSTLPIMFLAILCLVGTKFLDVFTNFAGITFNCKQIYFGTIFVIILYYIVRLVYECIFILKPILRVFSRYTISPSTMTKIVLYKYKLKNLIVVDDINEQEDLKKYALNLASELNNNELTRLYYFLGELENYNSEVQEILYAELSYAIVYYEMHGQFKLLPF